MQWMSRAKQTELRQSLPDFFPDIQTGLVTYAGGVGSMEDIELLRKYGKDRLDVTVGSALDLFGGTIPFETLINL